MVDISFLTFTFDFGVELLLESAFVKCDFAWKGAACTILSFLIGRLLAPCAANE